MLFFKRYLLPRIVQFLVVVFVGITIVFIVPRLTPVDPVQQVINRITAQGAFLDPAAVDSMRKSLTGLDGLEGSMLQQYFFWEGCSGDFGLPYSSFLSLSLNDNDLSTLDSRVTDFYHPVSWIVGSLLGGLAGSSKMKMGKIWITYL